MSKEWFDQPDTPLTEEEVCHLEAHGQTLRRQSGHVFIQHGERTDFLLLIRKGYVEIVSGEPEEKIVAIRGPGEMIGEMAPILQEPRSGTVVALDEVEVLHISASEWQRFLAGHPRALYAQYVATIRRYGELTTKFVESDLIVEMKLAKALIRLAESGVGKKIGGDVVLRFSQDQLAKYIGSSQVAVKKVLKVFKEQGAVTTGRQAVTITDLDVLGKIANSYATTSIRGSDVGTSE